MKTAQRILFTALEMFNEHGEANVSSVDIAVELDISPGNLYYHFKGKEVMVLALYDLYREQLTETLSASLKSELSVHEFFCFLYLVLEKISMFRFLYHNPVDLTDKYHGLKKQLSREQLALEKCIEAHLHRFAAKQVIHATPAQVFQMVDLIGMVCSQSTLYASVKGVKHSEGESALVASLQRILFVLQPYLLQEKEQLLQLEEAIAGNTLSVGMAAGQDTP